MTITPIGYRCPQMFSVTVHNATVTPHTHIRADEGEIYINLAPNPIEQPAPEGREVFGYSSPRRDSYQWLGGYDNIGHHVFEFLTRLPFMSKADPVAVWDDLLPNAYSLIELTGFRYIKVPRHARFAKLQAWSTPVGRLWERKPDGTVVKDPYCYGQNIFRLRAMLDRGAAPGWLTGLRLYCRRSGAKHRNVLNEDEVIDALRANHFEIWDLAEMDVADQVRAMQEAALVVIPSGAGSPFTMFTDAPVIELAPKGINGVFGAKMWADVLNRPYVRLSGEPDGEARRDADYTIDVPTLIETVRRF